MKSTLLHIALAAFLFTGLVSCKDDDKEDPKPDTALAVTGTVQGRAWNGTGTIKGEDNVDISRSGWFVENDTLGILTFDVSNGDTSIIVVAKIATGKAFNGTSNVATDTNGIAVLYIGGAGLGVQTEGTVAVSGYSATASTINVTFNGKITATDLIGPDSVMTVNNLMLKNIPKYAVKPSELNQ